MFFNSALAYELGVLKKYAEPLLEQISPEDKEYAEAKRLLQILSFVLPIDSSMVNQNSILREFIGEI